MSRVEEIKPCPFCGSAAASSDWSADDRTWLYVRCMKCNAQGSGRRNDEPAAIAAWNRVASNAHDRDGYVLILAEDHARLCGSSARVQSLEAALREALNGIGWRGSGPDDDVRFYCEYCSESHIADELIKHKPDCRVLKWRLILSPEAVKEKDAHKCE